MTHDVVERLRALPPELPTPADRFDQVHRRVRRRRRRVGVASAVGGLALAGALLPVAAGLGGDEQTVGRDPAAATSSGPPTDGPLPGSIRVTELSDAVTVDRTGTATVDLGDPPPGATEVAIWLRCRSAGTYRLPDGSRVGCTDEGVDQDEQPMPLRARTLLPIRTDHTVTISTDPGSRWRLVASYVTTEVTDWGVNAAGQTFGVENERGAPDLIAVVATNGSSGYAYADQLDHPGGIPDPRTPEEAREYNERTAGRTVEIPVYESDGVTRIGTFAMSPG